MTRRAIHPNGEAKTDSLEFARWVKAVGAKLLRAGIDCEMVPVVQSDGELFLTVDCDDETGARIKAALYN